MSDIEKKIKLSDPSKIDDNAPMRVGTVYGGKAFFDNIQKESYDEIMQMNKQSLLDAIKKEEDDCINCNDFPFTPVTGFLKAYSDRYKQLFGTDYRMKENEILRALKIAEENNNIEDDVLSFVHNQYKMMFGKFKGDKYVRY